MLEREQRENIVSAVRSYSIGDIRLNAHGFRLHSSQSAEWFDGRCQLSVDHHRCLVIAVLGEIVQFGSDAELRG